MPAFGLRQRSSGRIARLGLVLAIVASAVVTGASSSPSGAPGAAAQRGSTESTSATPPPAAVASLLARAQELVFANQYRQAEATYRQALRLAPEDPDVHSALALFLAYRLDLAAARAEAERALALGPANARAFAVLCRVEDWAARLPEALAAGRRAVALGPDDALAHLFDAEALSDHGDIAAARAEIAAAARIVAAGGSAYERAEVHREEGNLARDIGQMPTAVSAFAAAAAAQPGWVERAVELADVEADAGDTAAARAATARAIALAPDDAAVLSRIASTAILATDYGAAGTATDRLLRLTPRDPETLELAAQVAMAGRGDPATARRLLLQALAIDPNDDRAAAYLLFLDRDVYHDEAMGQADLATAAADAVGDGATAPRVRPRVVDPDAVLADHARAALAAVNAVRGRAGLPPVHLDPRLSNSAAAHVFYWLFNEASPEVAGLGIHQEHGGRPGFSGVGPGERAAVWGWRDGPVGEDITHRGSPDAAVADWVNSVYHRFPILRPDLVAIGYADATIGPLPMEDMEFGFAFPDGRRAAPVVYPADGQTGVPPAFVDDELPDPVPPGGPRTTGYPVTVTFDQYSQVQLTSFDLHGPDGASLPAFLLAPTRQTEMSASLLPQAPLRPHTRYVAHLVAVVDGTTLDRSWSFVVGS